MNRQCGIDVIEITPQMIEAGLKVLWESGAVEQETRGFHEIIIGDILRAALGVGEAS